MTHPQDRLGVRRLIRSVQFLPTEVVVSYLTVPDDFRATGLTVSHELIIPLGDHEYDDELTEAYDACQRLLNDALEDLAALEPYDPHEDDNEDENDDDEPA